MIEKGEYFNCFFFFFVFLKWFVNGDLPSFMLEYFFSFLFFLINSVTKHTSRDYFTIRDKFNEEFLNGRRNPTIVFDH